jgi:VanZ family protein
VEWLKRWWPALAWAVAISGFSTGVFTMEHTSRIIIPILHWLLPHAANATLARIHYGIRKIAHFTEYFILSLLVLRGIRAGRPGTRFAWALVVVAIVACYASLDELHQRFVPGRTAAVADVLIDTSGGIAAQAVAALAMLLGHVRERRKLESAEALRDPSGISTRTPGS